MSTVFLSTPPGADLNLSVGRLRTVADDKMVAQLIHAPSAEVCRSSVGPPDTFGPAGLRGAVVNDYVFPAT